MESIGNYAFQNTSLTSFTFPQSTKTIGDYVFYACAGITTLSIPSGVQEVGAVGYGCANLLSINVDAGNANYSSVNGILYTKDMKTLVEYPAGKEGNSYSVSNGVSVIGDYAFHSQKYLETVLLPSTVTEIGDYAFYMMQKLSSFTVSENVKSVGDAPFQGDSSLKKLIFKASITDTPYSMCKDCTSLTDVTLGNSITEIYNRAFMGCTSLTNVIMPSKLQKIDGAAFLDCTSLVNVNYPTSLEYVSSSAFTDSGVTQFPNWLSKRDDGAYVSLGSIVFDGTYKYDMAYEVLDIVNSERSNVGLSGLKMDKELLESAMLRAAEIAAYYSHTRPDGSSTTSVSPLLYAENIAIGYSAATSVMNGWMSSTGHKANILGNYTIVGVGCFTQGGLKYWVQCFGKNAPEEFTKPTDKNVTITTNLLIEYLKSEYLSFRSSIYYFKCDEETQLEVRLFNTETTGFVCELNPTSFNWTTSNSEIETVNEKGIVTGHNPGNFTDTLPS